MSGSWNIDVSSTVSTIRATAAQAESVEPAVAGMEQALLLAASSIPGGVVVAALNDVVTNRLGPNAREAVARTGSIVTSTVQALSFYVHGDLEMASSAQRSAARAGEPSSLHGAGHRPLPL
ncbi:hypothetical protein QFZ40_001847 [Arthrobacter pascens]|uniref:DUF6507 family protein n=1 Tax=Arthrobacter pascens TaxID=1677 RepID=UPI0027842E1E|nr:DUF6507 family protein [Arthrobacter pascens]MDQ0633938.1 hypothetical protein [Arthrobacter pascens]